MAQCEEVQKLFAVSARYHGPNSGQVSADADMTEEKIHEAIVRKEYTDNKASTRKGDNTRLKRWYVHCQEKGFSDLHPYPATRVATYLNVDLDRNINAGNKGIGSNVQYTLNSLGKLAKIQGCPECAVADISLMTAVVNTAHWTTQAKALQKPNDHDKSAQNRQTLLVCWAPGLRSWLSLNGKRASEAVKLFMRHTLACSCKHQTNSVI